MALINLNQIDKLRTQANLRKCVAYSYVFAPKKETPVEMDDELFVDIIRCSQQAKNLLKQIRKLHEICVDFAFGNTRKYIDSHHEFGADEPYDPFHEFEYLFDSGTIYDLPSQIEQYEELCVLSAGYVHQQELQDQALTEFLPSLTRYVAIVEDNQPVLIPEEDLPEDVREQKDIELQAGRIDVEYCLDGYNQFYANCQAIIGRNRLSGTAEDCAREILSMYAPVKQTES